eukprot:358299-Chlamydomonas_euryale.AAC.12
MQVFPHRLPPPKRTCYKTDRHGFVIASQTVRVRATRNRPLSPGKPVRDAAGSKGSGFMKGDNRKQAPSSWYDNNVTKGASGFGSMTCRQC